MPCDDPSCRLPTTPPGTGNHTCRRCRSARLHGICGLVDPDQDYEEPNEQLRVCSTGVGGGGSGGGGDADQGSNARRLVPVPPYSVLADAFLFLEGYADSTGVAGASAGLRTAKMAFLAAYATIPTRQSNVRDYFRPAGGGGAAGPSSSA